jgi:hypothetical protein
MIMTIGDRVRIKAPSDWPSPPGYRFAGAEGTVCKWVDYDAAMAAYADGIVCVSLDKVPAAAEAYAGDALIFRAEDVEKL